MASDHFNISISEKFISDTEKRFEPSSKHGADIRFHGVVRDIEDDRVITGIEYSSYPGMAEKELESICQAMGEAVSDHLVDIHHRLGFVPAGEASIIIRVQTAHSAAGFEIATEYLKRIKQTVPIWKKPVFAAG